MMYGRGYGYNGYGNMMDGGGWFIGLMMLLFGLLVLAAIVLLVLWAVRASRHPHGDAGQPPMPGQAGHHDAVAIAKKRLASGEITPEQYAEIMRHLGG